MRELISTKVSIDFMGKRHICTLLSIILVGLSIALFVRAGDSKYGTDFSGGHEFLVGFTTPQDSPTIRAKLAEQKLEEVRVQAFQGMKNEFSIRLGDTGDATAVRARVESALRAAFGETAKIEKTDYVGPTVGAELRRSGLIAVSLSILGILLYIAIRFEFAIGVGTIVALCHDVIICTGIYIASGHLIGMATIAAALTIVGYSVNDTVVIFDRVREERAKRRNYDIGILVNEAINFTLSRTLITHGLTLISAVALYVIGTGEIKDLSLFLVAGIICGAYSTIFVVAPIVIMIERRRKAPQTVSQRGAAQARSA
jgi:preprotein translocase subunit SecF